MTADDALMPTGNPFLQNPDCIAVLGMGIDGRGYED